MTNTWRTIKRARGKARETLSVVKLMQHSFKSMYLYWKFLRHDNSSRVAQWKRAGPITQRSVDRNHALLETFYFAFVVCVYYKLSVKCYSSIFYQNNWMRKIFVLFKIWSEAWSQCYQTLFFLCFPIFIVKLECL